MQYKNISILYVENDLKAREKLTRFLSSVCKELYLAEDGEMGLELYKEHQVDIVISDIRIPKIDGLEMVARIKEINSKQLVIFTTAYIDSQYLFKAIELQVDGYISKPVDFKKLQREVDKCIVEIEAKEALVKLQESEERARTILETAQLGVFIYKEKFIYVNDRLAKLLGYTKEEIYEIDAWGLVTEDLKEVMHAAVLKRIKGESMLLVYNDVRLVKKDGSILPCRVATETIQYEGEYAGLGTFIDLTDIFHTQKHLKQLAQAMEQMDEMVRITDKNGYIIYVNQALTRHTEYTKSEILGKSNKIFYSGKHDKAFYEKMYANILAKKSYKEVFINLKKSGEFYCEEQMITPIVDEESEEIEYFVSTSKDVTKQMELQNQMEILATIDSLTLIYNRYSINKKIEEEVSRSKRYGGSFALLMLDVDFFKRVNDTYGHDTGDYVLQKLCQVVLGSIRETDFFGRWGGEEFILFAPNEEREGALLLAEKIRKNIETFHFKKVAKLTVSIGVTVCDTCKDKVQLLKQVDEALYEAKKRGRNRVVYRECSCCI